MWCRSSDTSDTGSGCDTISDSEMDDTMLSMHVDRFCSYYANDAVVQAALSQSQSSRQSCLLGHEVCIDASNGQLRHMWVSLCIAVDGT